MLYDRVVDSLKTVYDPCSVAVSAPVSVYDMGLVTRIDVVEAGSVAIAVRPTAMGCSMMMAIMQGIDDVVSAIPEVSSVQVSLDLTMPWSEESMSEDGRRILTEARARAPTVSPREWERSRTSG